MGLTITADVAEKTEKKNHLEVILKFPMDVKEIKAEKAP